MEGKHMSEFGSEVSELQSLGAGYKTEIKNPQREQQTLKALMQELSGEK